MPRRLPWKTSGSSPNIVHSPKIKPESPRGTPSRPPSVPSAPFTKKLRHERVEDPNRTRSPSTSPPPEPPKEEFMIPGPLADDRFRMVEDEFLSTANKFTTHLHRAEYNRLKNLAKTTNAAAIREIERPVVGAPTRLARQRSEGVKRALKQQRAGIAGDEKPWMGTSLQGLMESPRKAAKWLPSGTVAATTRASAGFSSNLESPSKRLAGVKRQFSAREEIDVETGDEEDDLATPARRGTMNAMRATPASSSTTSRSLTWPTNPARTSTSSPLERSKPTPSASRATRHIPVTPRSRSNDQADEDDEDDPFGIDKRRIKRQKSREHFKKPEPKDTPKKRSPDTIPSFL